MASHNRRGGYGATVAKNQRNVLMKTARIFKIVSTRRAFKRLFDFVVTNTGGRLAGGTVYYASVLVGSPCFFAPEN